MPNVTKPSFFNRVARPTVLFLSVLALMIPALALGPAMTAPLGGQLRDKLRERIQERRGQTGQRGQRGQQGTADEVLKIAGLDVAVWRPAESRSPLVVFSHGFGGCNINATYLTEALADAGYLVVAPNHDDSRCNSGGRERPEEKWGRPEDWSDRTYDDRRDDINALINALRQDRQWSSRIDWSRVALAGHSLGGYTVLGLAGAWPSWRISTPIKAVLAMSPVCNPYAVKGSLGSIRVPVMYQGGTRDFGITPGVKKQGGCFAQTSSPAIFVEFEGTNHFGWADYAPGSHDLIVHYAVAFLDKYVRGNSTRSSPFTKQRGVTDLRVK